jgi:hypothetical protein
MIGATLRETARQRTRHGLDVLAQIAAISVALDALLD